MPAVDLKTLAKEYLWLAQTESRRKTRQIGHTNAENIGGEFGSEHRAQSTQWMSVSE